jgi:hypothetical protein
VVEKEELVFDCRSIGSGVSCTFSATYYLFNPTVEKESVLGAFYGNSCEDVAVGFDGAEVTRRLTPEEFSALDTRVNADVPDGNNPSSYLKWVERLERLKWHGKRIAARRALDLGLDRLPGFFIELKPGSRHVLSVTGEISPGAFVRSGVPIYFTAVEGRHLAMNRVPPGKPFSGEHFKLEYFLSPIKSWAAVHEIHIVIHSADDLEQSGGMTAHAKTNKSVSFENVISWDDSNQTHPASNGWTVLSEKGRTVARWKRAEESSESTIPDELWIAFDREAPPVYPGGLTLGAGALVYRGDRAFCASLGYEIARPEWLLGSLSVETDFVDTFTVVPMLKVASPWMFLFVPSVGVGVGVPIQIRFEGGADVGIRAQADFMFGPIGVAVPFDFFPGIHEGEDERMQLSVMGQLSF